ncbi:glycoside hydrolase family 108 protein [Methylobacterium sp. yr596]|uniref:glycoside hydrolase family 108 protein n=1 Tax=Methylobacterium sp. yr596 TaxID=1761800 RepID=UPI0008EBD1EF|nr:glycoside hydrolase family 108 protein [Methylobacterium sp. yr596]SFE90649.1 Lysozyme family protein [Methylobacterium sp. yr596]
MAAATFDTAIAYVLAHEGGYVNNPRDPGGPTCLGITQATLAAHRGRPVTKADVRALGRDEAEAIYRAEYWDRARCDALPAGLDYAVMDLAVNSGVGRAARFLQTLLKARGLYAGDVDGVLGVKSLAALAGLKDVARFIRDLCGMRLRYLKSLGGWSAFRKGWGRRVAEVQDAALKIAGGSLTLALADLPDPVPTVRGDAAQVAAARTLPGKATALAVLGVVGDQASSYASTFSTLQDIAPVFRYAFAACTVVGVVAGLWKAVQLAKRAEPGADKAASAPEAANDDVPAVEPASGEPMSEKSDTPAAATVAA